jgi:hypothetical protein
MQIAAEQARQNALHAGSTVDQEVAINYPTNSYTTMAVVDGVVISPPVHNLTFTQFTMAKYYLISKLDQFRRKQILLSGLLLLCLAFLVLSLKFRIQKV